MRKSDGFPAGATIILAVVFAPVLILTFLVESGIFDNFGANLWTATKIFVPTWSEFFGFI